MNSKCPWSKTDLTLFEHIMRYKSGYNEKTLLLNEAVAETISTNVLAHSRGDESSTFYDGEGGLCLIAKYIKDRNVFGKVEVFEKDSKLDMLHEYAENRYFGEDIRIHNINLSKMASDALRYRQHFESPLGQLLCSNNGSSEEDVPSAVVVSTASQSVLKYLVTRMLLKHQPNTEFYSSRPEFFLVMSARTYFHLCCSDQTVTPVTSRMSTQEMRMHLSESEKLTKLVMPYNVMFQLLFDFCLLDILPRSAYFPWKPFIRHGNNKPRPIRGKEYLTSLYRDYHDSLMLVYVRPRKDEEMEILRPHYLEYFLRKVLKDKKQSIVAVFEEWLSDSGLELIKAGYNIFTTVQDLSLDQMLAVFRLLVSIPGFESSNFVAEAEIFLNEDTVSSSELYSSNTVENMKESMRRDLASGRGVSPANNY